MSEELAFMSVRELGRLLRNGTISSTELTRFFLARLSTSGRELGAVVTITDELALQQSLIAERELASGIDRGPLHGIPYGLKDVIATVGVPTTWGAAPFRERVFKYDGTVVRRLREAGAVLVAKLASLEMAGSMGIDRTDASFTGVTSNPWDRSTWVGGSSSGSGAAVAAGTVPFAIGSDTAGSIIIPAAWSGICGLRGTFGRVSNFGGLHLCWSIDRTGPMTRTAEDCGLVLEQIAGYDGEDGTTCKASYHYRRPVPRRRGFRFGVIDGLVTDQESEVRANFVAAVEALEEIGSVEAVSLPEFPYKEVLYTILWSETYANHREFIDSGGTSELNCPLGHVAPLAMMAVSAHAYLRAAQIRRLMSRAILPLLRQFDAVLTPTLPQVATPHVTPVAEALRPSWPGELNLASNLVGFPTITVPNGFGAGGLPTGIEFCGAPYTENALLDAASAYQGITSWHRNHPADNVSLKSVPS